MNDIQRADAVYEALLARAGEAWVEPRMERVGRLLELLGDPQRSYRVIHITGTNGKTSTSRMIESLLRAHDLRTGLFTSPHLERFTERIMIDGAPISDAAVADAWDELVPLVHLVDAELVGDAQAPLTFFEVLTALAFVACADAPVDVLVLEVGMGGAWDSTNAADGDIAVFTPIDIDHADRLGSTVAEIAAVKAGIIKDGAAVVSARQTDAAAAVLREHAAARGASIAFEGDAFAVESAVLAVGGQMLTVRGLAARYADEYLPQYGRHQAHNAALAIAAVESFIGGGAQPIPGDILSEGLATATSPGRLQLVGVSPTVLVDAAHNPHGARALAAAIGEFFDFDEWALVLGVFDDKNAAGIVDALAPVVSRVFTTEPASPRASDAESLADLVEAHGIAVSAHPAPDEAMELARRWAAEGERRAVLIAGSIVLAGEAISFAESEGWKA